MKCYACGKLVSALNFSGSPMINSLSRVTSLAIVPLLTVVP